MALRVADALTLRSNSGGDCEVELINLETDVLLGHG